MDQNAYEKLTTHGCSWPQWQPTQTQPIHSSHVQTALLRDPEIKEVWSDYLLQYGAVHAANWQRPDLGARFLTTQLRSEASNRLLPGPLRIAIDAYLQALRYCNEGALRSIASNDLADLISRTDSRHVKKEVALVGWGQAVKAREARSVGLQRLVNALPGLALTQLQPRLVAQALKGYG